MARTRRSRASRRQRGGFLDWLFGSSNASASNTTEKKNEGIMATIGDALAAPAQPNYSATANAANATNVTNASYNNTSVPVGGRRKSRAARKAKKSRKATKSRKSHRKSHRKTQRKH